MTRKKIFKDATQGYISIDESYVTNLIDTFEMQRLKHVAQTGMRSVYSGATHDRFSHALGVYNIAISIFSAFKTNVLSGLKSELKKCNKCDIEKGLYPNVEKKLDEYEVYYKIACILHDIGHPAFSHTLEYLYNDNSLLIDPASTDQLIYINRTELERILKEAENPGFVEPDRLRNELANELSRFYDDFCKNNNIIQFGIDTNSIKSSEHELMGALQILRLQHLKKSITQSLSDAKPSDYNPDNAQKTDLGFIACMIVGAKYKHDDCQYSCQGGCQYGCQHAHFVWEASLRNCVVELLNGVIDADSIDYLNRNSHFAGYTTTNLDITRLTGAFSAQYDSNHEMFIPCIEKNALSVIEGFINARNFEPKWLYSHHKMVYCNQFLYPYLYKKCCRILFADDQSRWEGLANKKFRKEVKKYKISSVELSSNEDWQKITENFQIELYQKLLTRIPEIRPIAAKIRGVKFAIAMEILADNNIKLSEEKQKIMEKYFKFYSKATFLPATLLNMGEKFENNFCEYFKGVIKSINDDNRNDAEEIMDLMIKWSNVFVKIKNAYLGYVIAPLAYFQGGTRAYSNWKKSTDNDIEALFKRMYLRFKDQKYLSLSKKIKALFNENEYHKFKDALEEFHTRHYRNSLWKSYEEYMLFLKRIEKSTGLNISIINDMILDELIIRGFKEEFENAEGVYKQTPENDKRTLTAVFMNAAEDDTRADKNFKNVFGRFGSGLVICIYKEKYKDFGNLKIHFNEDIIGRNDTSSLVSYRELTGFKPKDTNYYPYIYYQPDKIMNPDQTREELLDELARNISNWINEKLKGESSMSNHFGTDIKGKIFRDPVHGDIFVPERFLKIIDTAVLQRMRRIKQLATAELVFPEANHTRFSHSLGTFYVMSLLLKRLCQLFDQLGIPHSAEEEDAVLAAALLHDVGHGPYSHAFECVSNGEKHEEWTRKIITEDKELKEVLDTWPNGHNRFTKYLLYCLNMDDSSEDWKLINVFSSLISSQLDADRIDYLMRDSYNTGINFGQLDLQRLISGMSLCEYNGKMRICFDVSALPAVEQFIIGRFNMYDSVYFAPYKVFSEILIAKIVRGLSQEKELPSDSVIRLISEGNLHLEKYLSQDDAAFRNEIEKAEEKVNNKILSKMIDCFLNRKGYTRVRILGESSSEVDQFLNDFEEKYAFRLEACQSVISGVRNYSAYTSAKSGKPLKEILISHRNGIVTPLDEVSKIFPNEKKGTGTLWYTQKAYLYVNFALLEEEPVNTSKVPVSEIKAFIDSYDIRKHMEIEQKFSCGQEQFEKACQIDAIQKIDAFKCYQFEDIADANEQTDIYFDTEDFLLERKGFSFRQRNKNIGKYKYTIKGVADSGDGYKDGQFIRTEFELKTVETCLSSNELLKFAKKHLNDLFETNERGAYEPDKLKPVVKIKNNRKKYNVSRPGSLFECEVCFDAVTFEDINNENSSQKDYQIEIELTSTDSMHRIELRNFSNQLKDYIGTSDIVEEVASKYAKAVDVLRLKEK